MGWANGSELAEGIWLEIRKYIPKDKKQKVARKLIDMFEDMDCDTINECETLLKAAFKIKALKGMTAQQFTTATE
jgi:hypothetical protein